MDTESGVFDTGTFDNARFDNLSFSDDNVTLSEDYNNAITFLKILSDAVNSTDSADMSISKFLNDLIDVVDGDNKIFHRGFFENVSTSDLMNKNIGGFFEDSTNINELLNFGMIKNLKDNSSVVDYFTRVANLFRTITELVNSSDVISKITTKNLQNLVSATDSIDRDIDKNFIENISIEDSHEFAWLLELLENITAGDCITLNRISKQISQIQTDYSEILTEANDTNTAAGMAEDFSGIITETEDDTVASEMISDFSTVLKDLMNEVVKLIKNNK